MPDGGARCRGVARCRHGADRRRVGVARDAGAGPWPLEPRADAVPGMSVSEIPGAIDRVEAFARRHGIHTGIQVSPVSLHGTLMSEFDRRGWGTRWPVLVLAARREDSARADSRAWAAGPGSWFGPTTPRRRGSTPGRGASQGATSSRTPAPCSRGWLGARRSRVSTTWRSGSRSRGMAWSGCSAWPSDPARRRSGLGTGVVRALLAASGARVAYLQVEERNVPGGGAVQAARVRRGLPLLSPDRALKPVVRRRRPHGGMSLDAVVGRIDQILAMQQHCSTRPARPRRLQLAGVAPHSAPPSG